jgi:hypothetical protein
MQETKKKVCSKCNVEKNIGDYYNYTRNGIVKKNSTCKDCNYENSKKYKVFYTSDYTIPDLENEVWKDIPSLDNMYQASNMGRIKSKEREIIKKEGRSYIKPQQLLSYNNNGRGYLSVMLAVDGKYFRRYVHRLVMEAFYGESKLTVDHINRDKYNNTLDNLRYLTQRENTVAFQEQNENKSCKSIGVSFYKGLGRFGASIKVGIDSYSLGTYDSEEEASAAYQKALHNWEVLGIPPREKKRTGKRDKKLKGIYLNDYNKYCVFNYFNYKQYYLKGFTTIEEAELHRDRLYEIIPKTVNEELLRLIIEEYKNKYLND